MTTSREKVDRIVVAMTEHFGIREVDLLFKKVDVQTEMRKKMATIKDSKLDVLVDEIKDIVNED